MFFGPRSVRSVCPGGNASRTSLLVLLALQAFPFASAALPGRLVLALDGIAYRDMTSLQAGVTYTNIWGRRLHRRAFSSSEGYFPASRLISTFPSTSDVAWTDIFGDRPLPGYQRTYFSVAANSEIVENGVTTSMEHERQMDWQVENGFIRAMGYVYSVHTFEYELRGLVKNFWQAKNDDASYYIYIRASDDAQHLDRDIFSMLCMLDGQLQEMRARYKAQEGRDLQILILSDHGHNHAGPGTRVEVRAFLEKAGYRIAKSIVNPKDVVLPTAGIESWVEIHNSPAETETLVQLLTRLNGVDLLMAPDSEQTNRFIVMNSKGERAGIEWNPAKTAFRYSIGKGDPLNYRPVVEALARKNLLDADGFATADAWMAVTMTNRYPLALERIVRGLTRVTLNPATILISLDNHYVNAGWLVEKGSRLVTCGSTHGGLDDINSDGIVLSNFTPTRDTSSSRVAGLFDDFPGLRQFRAEENGAEWVTEKEQTLARIARTPFDRDCQLLPNGDVFLRVWSPQFSRVDGKNPVEATIKKVPRFSGAQIRRGDSKPADAPGLRLVFTLPVSFPGKCAYERIYACPSNLVLEPQAEYQISGWIHDQGQNIHLFEFTFHADSHGRPAAY